MIIAIVFYCFTGHSQKLIVPKRQPIHLWWRIQMMHIHLLQNRESSSTHSLMRRILRMNQASILIMTLGQVFTFPRRRTLHLNFTVSYSDDRVIKYSNSLSLSPRMWMAVAPVMAIKGKTFVTIKRNDQLLRLKCRVYGSPLPKTQWLKESMYLVDSHTLANTDQLNISDTNESDDSFTIYNDSLSFSISNEVKSKCSIKSTLTLTVNTENDLGWYHCIAKNIHGKVYASYRIEGEFLINTVHRWANETPSPLVQLNRHACSLKIENSTSLASSLEWFHRL